MPPINHRAILDAAVAQLGGEVRPGQVAMADAVAASFDSGVHLLVQAGTGTGKSLGYLAPALAQVLATEETVVVATATLALQSQLASKDIPLALDAVEKVTGRRPEFAVLKGRANYACLLKVRGSSHPDQGELFGAVEAIEPGTTSALGAQVLALREWAEEQASNGGVADRDDAPPHTARAWAQVSMPARECVGAAKCRFGAECFVEESRRRAREAQLVVTNHALLAIDAMHGNTALPEHSLVVVDEAHELVARVTGAASAELSPQLIERVARRATTWVQESTEQDLIDAGVAFGEALEDMEPRRVAPDDSAVLDALGLVRAASRAAFDELSDKSGEADSDRQQVAAAVKEVFDVAERMAKLDDADVVWVSGREKLGRQAVVAPLSVAGLMRERVFGQVTTVLTSATLTLGGNFDAVAGGVGLRASERVEEVTREDSERAVSEWAWRGTDVGSPFDYRRQSILYVARDVPRPGREGIGGEALDRIVELVSAAGGRTLGLFASQRSAEAAADYVRAQRGDLTILCQGDAQLGELTRRFIDDPETCLFGTLSLWQGVDVPGDTCRLVIIDKIPFPRPDDPLMQARQKAVAEAGGNGFMSVAATHAALLLAQGSGRLIRRADDRGVVAVLDPRLVTARYGSFLRKSMPDFWTTTDASVVMRSLRNLGKGI